MTSEPGPDQIHPFFSLDRKHEKTVVPVKDDTSTASIPAQHQTTIHGLFSSTPNNVNNSLAIPPTEPLGEPLPVDSTLKVQLNGHDGPIPPPPKRRRIEDALGSGLRNEAFSNTSAGLSDITPRSKKQTPADQAVIEHHEQTLEVAPPPVQSDNASGPTSLETNVTPPNASTAKVLGLKPNGTLLSPVSKVRDDATEEPRHEPAAPARRPRRKKRLIVVMKYGKDLIRRMDIGRQIKQILSSVPSKSTIEETVDTAQPTIPVTPPRATRKLKAEGTRQKDAKSGRQVPSSLKISEKVTQVSPRKRETASTPGKIRTAAELLKRSEGGSTSKEQTKRAGATGQPVGGLLPPWAGGALHIRIEQDDRDHSCTSTQNLSAFVKRKEKYSKFGVPEHESVLRFNDSSSDNNQFLLPMRRLLTGRDLQAAIKSQIRGSHPAVENIFNQLYDYLSPYDHLQSESQAWTVKYAPQLTRHVLSVTSGLHVLKDWVQSLRVTNVQKTDARAAPAPKPFKMKRYRKADDMDDFIVSDDDLDASGNEKICPVLLLTGPTGSGKTAAVYAVAHELQYRVFEINSGSRRTRKDLFERLSDISSNHLVGHGRPAQKLEPDNQDSCESGYSTPVEKQPNRSINSFFGAAASKSGGAGKAPGHKSKPSKDLTTVKRKSVQGQSIILFEEVDVLFEDDKQFWQTILDLAIASKRPIILTCCDASRVPTMLKFHASIHVSYPFDVDAVDYLLCIAAKEGHLIERQAIEYIWTARNGDIRGALNDLQLWCQIGIGDKKRGLNWFLQRWPSTKGLDEHGKPLRVVSQGTITPSLVDSCVPGQQEKSDLSLSVTNVAKPSSPVLDHTTLEALSFLDIYEQQILRDDYDDARIKDDNHAFSVPELPAHTFLQRENEDFHPHIQDDLIHSTSLLTSTTQHGAPPLPDRTSTRDDLEDIFHALGEGSDHWCETLSPLSHLVMEIAPYVRSIVAFDLLLGERRAPPPSSEESNAGKKMRTTRASRSAMEGSQREHTRPDRYFAGVMEYRRVMETGYRCLAPAGLYGGSV